MSEMEIDVTRMGDGDAVPTEPPYAEATQEQPARGTAPLSPLDMRSRPCAKCAEPFADSDTVHVQGQEARHEGCLPF